MGQSCVGRFLYLLRIDTLAARAYISPEHIFYRMPPTPFGERLKRERELRGVSLGEVSGATKINTKYLEALETEQWDRLPGGFFNRGFIRTIARYLGLNEDGLMSEYALVTKDHPTVTVWVQDLEKRRKPWVSVGIVALIVAIVVAGGWLAAKRWGGVAHVEARPVKVSEAAPMIPGDSLPSDTAASAAAEPSRDHAEMADGKMIQDTAPPAAGADQAAATVVPAADAVAPRAEKLELRIQAGRKARIRVAADGHSQFAGWIAAGETREYSARDTFQVFASDSSAVFIELNGKTIAPLGMPGRPGHATITRKDLGDSTGGVH